MAGRIIMHLDMDYFFAAVEERRRPELKGKPLIVGADPKEGRGRGVVSACNYEARRFGVHSGMPISHAWRLCPNGTYLPVDFPAYIDASARIMGILKNHARKIEQAGIDEAYMDVSFCSSFSEAEAFAFKIKKEISEKERLTCSIGIGPNKLVAKLATDLQKPDGITIIISSEIPVKIWPLHVGRLPGIGAKTEPMLAKAGMRTIGDIARMDANSLIDLFGKAGYELHRLANGIDDRPVEEELEPKSISREVTFEKDISNPATILKAIEELSKYVHEAVIDSSYFFKNIGIKIRFSNFETHTRAKTVKPTDSLEILEKTAKELAKPFLEERKKVRLVGVRVSGLEKRSMKPLKDFAVK